MPYIGQSPSQVAFLVDTFNGNGSTIVFTTSVAPANTASVLVAISGVVQDPSTYSVSGSTLTFSAAPPTGTGNISCRYLGIPASGVTTTAYSTRTEFTATAGQTSFSTPSYTAGFIQVYRNGILLGTADYTATTGTTVVLASGATAGDLVTTISFYVSSVLNAIPATTGSVGSTYLANNLSLTSPTLSSPTINGTYTGGTSLITSGTVVSSTSGTSIDFTSIPSWVKRITVMFNGVSTNGTSPIQIQLGAGLVQTTGYSCNNTNTSTSTANLAVVYTTGFVVLALYAAANTAQGQSIFSLLDVSTGVWANQSIIAQNGAYSGLSFCSGSKTLSGTLDRVRITTVNGTDTFDAGSINIIYE